MLVKVKNDAHVKPIHGHVGGETMETSSNGEIQRAIDVWVSLYFIHTKNKFQYFYLSLLYILLIFLDAKETFEG